VVLNEDFVSTVVRVTDICPFTTGPQALQTFDALLYYLARSVVSHQIDI
jgi:hypothetical protein